MGEEKAKELEKINAESLQVRNGFAFHDPNYICQFETEKEYGMPISAFIRELKKMGYVHEVVGTYKKLKYRKCVEFYFPQLTQKAIDENAVQCVINPTVDNWKDVYRRGYCFRIRKDIAYPHEY